MHNKENRKKIKRMNELAPDESDGSAHENVFRE